MATPRAMILSPRLAHRSIARHGCVPSSSQAAALGFVRLCVPRCWGLAPHPSSGLVSVMAASKRLVRKQGGRWIEIKWDEMLGQ